MDFKLKKYNKTSYDFRVSLSDSYIIFIYIIIYLLKNILCWLFIGQVLRVMVFLIYNFHLLLKKFM